MKERLYSDGLSPLSYLAEIHQGCQIIKMPSNATSQLHGVLSCLIFYGMNATLPAPS